MRTFPSFSASRLSGAQIIFFTPGHESKPAGGKEGGKISCKKNRKKIENAQGHVHVTVIVT